MRILLVAALLIAVMAALGYEIVNSQSVPASVVQDKLFDYIADQDRENERNERFRAEMQTHIVNHIRELAEVRATAERTAVYFQIILVLIGGSLVKDLFLTRGVRKDQSK